MVVSTICRHLNDGLSVNSYKRVYLGLGWQEKKCLVRTHYTVTIRSKIKNSLLKRPDVLAYIFLIDIMTLKLKPITVRFDTAQKLEESVALPEWVSNGAASTARTP